MQNLLKLSSLALLVVMLMTACETDPIDPPTDTPPSITFISDAAFVSSDTDLAAGETFQVQVSAVSGTNPLNSLEIFADGSKLSTDFIVDVNGNSPANNPTAVVSDDDKNSFTWVITLIAQADGTVNYEFVVSDNMQLTDAVSLNISVASEPPSLTVEGDGMFMVAPNSLVSMTVTATAGSAALSTIAVLQDGVTIDPTRVRFDGTEFAENPLTIEGGNKDGFTVSIIIRSQEETGAQVYSIVVADEAGNTASSEVTISSGTPIAEFEAVLVSNADGPSSALGGLDLDNGENVPSASADAEIRDLGIDNSQTAANNWIQKVEAVNGAALRLPSTDQPEGFKYENISSVEAIQAAYESGTAVSETNKLAVGDVFLVASGAKYWIVQTAEVVVKENDNTDFYRFNIKGSE